MLSQHEPKSKLNEQSSLVNNKKVLTNISNKDFNADVIINHIIKHYSYKDMLILGQTSTFFYNYVNDRKDIREYVDLIKRKKPQSTCSTSGMIAKITSDVYCSTDNNKGKAMVGVGGFCIGIGSWFGAGACGLGMGAASGIAIGASIGGCFSFCGLFSALTSNRSQVKHSRYESNTIHEDLEQPISKSMSY